MRTQIGRSLLGATPTRQTTIVLRLPRRQPLTTARRHFDRPCCRRLSTSSGERNGDASFSRDDSQSHIIKEFRELILHPAWFPEASIVDILLKWYPEHIVIETPRSTGLLDFAKAGYAVATLETRHPFYGHREYKVDKTLNDRNGSLETKVAFARFNYSWHGRNFPVYEVNFWTISDYLVSSYYILLPRDESDLLDGQSRFADELISAAAQHDRKVEEEIWVYDRGGWNRNEKLWKAVQSSTWDKVILNADLKRELLGDIESFFDRKDDYAAFAVPWKRGIILHGLPGNGKTISIKALMRSLYSRQPPIPTLYIKSLGKGANQDDIRSIFEKARETSPCLLVLEDIDSLVSDSIKSFFLNEVDGLESNDGIMMIGSTNYLDRLDPGISKRPSRFDRKYHFALPALTERVLYCDYWKAKVTRSSSLRLPDRFSSAVANITEGFSFAYLQEAFVTALLSLVPSQRTSSPRPNPSTPATTKSDDDLESNEAWQVIRRQIETLRKEMKDSKKSVEDAGKNSVLSEPRSGSGVSAGFGLGR